MTSYIRKHFHQLAVRAHLMGLKYRRAGDYDMAFRYFTERRIQIERSKQ